MSFTILWRYSAAFSRGEGEGPTSRNLPTTSLHTLGQVLAMPQRAPSTLRRPMSTNIPKSLIRQFSLSEELTLPSSRSSKYLRRIMHKATDLLPVGSSLKLIDPLHIILAHILLLALVVDRLNTLDTKTIQRFQVSLHLNLHATPKYTTRIVTISTCSHSELRQVYECEH